MDLLPCGSIYVVSVYADYRRLGVFKCVAEEINAQDGQGFAIRILGIGFSHHVFLVGVLLSKVAPKAQYIARQLGFLQLNDD